MIGYTAAATKEQTSAANKRIAVVWRLRRRGRSALEDDGAGDPSPPPPKGGDRSIDRSIARERIVGRVRARSHALGAERGARFRPIHRRNRIESNRIGVDGDGDGYADFGLPPCSKFQGRRSIGSSSVQGDDGPRDQTDMAPRPRLYPFRRKATVRRWESLTRTVALLSGVR